MNLLNVRQATRGDEPFLWRMLYYAAHMDEQGADVSAAMNQPALATYVAGWGRPGDLGFVAVGPAHNEPIGAAWLREFTDANAGYGFLVESVPELAVSVLPSHIGQGIGTLVLRRLLDAAARKYRAVSLNVRQSSPAVRLYERLGFRKIAGSEMINRVGGVSFNMELAFGADMPGAGAEPGGTFRRVR